jgi:MerR family transcriptional regulator/heat shock protein HspR
MSKAIVIYTQEEQTIYLRSSAARLAGVSEDFLVRCEQEGLIACLPERGGKTGFDRKTIQRLSLIKRLHGELELDLDTIELVLHLRRQIIDLQHDLERLERKAYQRERQLLSELQQLRRTLTKEAHIKEEG